MIFLEVVLPIVAVIGIGALFARISGRELRPLSDLTLYVLSPALVFSYIARSDMTVGEFVQVGIFGTVSTVAMIVVALVSLWGFRVPRDLGPPMLLASVFGNIGNYGLPVLLFAYGTGAFERGVVLVVVQAVLMYSLGVLFASWGSAWRTAALNILKQPAVYAGVLGVIVNLADVSVPDPIYRPLRLMGNAMIPVTLLVLGMQLATAQLSRLTSFVTVSSFVRLVLGPLVGLAVVVAMGIGGELGRVLVVQSAMPSAVIPVLFAVEYEAHPELVSATAFVSTLVSFATVFVVLEALDSGLVL